MHSHIQPRKLSNSRLVQPLNGHAPFLHLHANHALTQRKVSTIEWVSALAGVLHTCIIIVMGCILLVSLAPHWRDWRWVSGAIGSTGSNTRALHTTTRQVATAHSSSTISNMSANGGSGHSSNEWWLSSPTTSGQAFLFLLSASYFFCDILLLHLRHRLSTSKGQRLFAHHLLSVTGLVGCVCTGRDGPLVLVALLLAELSNPPMHLLTLARYISKSANSSTSVGQSSLVSDWLRRCVGRSVLVVCAHMDLDLLHVLVFLFTRLMCLQFTAHAVMPFAQLTSTKLCSVSLLLLSGLMFLDLVQPLQQSDQRDREKHRCAFMQLSRQLTRCETAAAMAAGKEKEGESGDERVSGSEGEGFRSRSGSSTPSMGRRRLHSRGSGGMHMGGPATARVARTASMEGDTRSSSANNQSVVSTATATSQPTSVKKRLCMMA